MNIFGDLTFFILLGFVLIPAIILGFLERPIRFYSFVASAFIIFVVLEKNIIAIAWFLGFCVYSFLITRIYLYRRTVVGKLKCDYFLALALLILPLACHKMSGLFQQNWLSVLGISYITFRVLQIIIETYDGLIVSIGTFDFFSFLLFFPTVSSGPIDRSARYIKDLNVIWTRIQYADLLGTGLQKILLGVVYKFVFSGICFGWMSLYQSPTTIGSIFLYAYCYGFYLFFDFAGYSLMAVGSGYILGIRVPDNFNKPFISVDIKDFWNRWHISLSSWFRDFIFARFVMNSIRKKRFSSKIETACVGYIVNMIIMGMWHGFVGEYLLYGVYHGILLAGTEIYQKKSKFHSMHKVRIWYKPFSIAITFHLVMFGFLIFSGVINKFFETKFIS